MRKHIHTTGIILICWMIAANVEAGIWPASLSPLSGGYSRGNESLSGAVERLTVTYGAQAWTNYITTNIWADYFSDATKLRLSKQMLKASFASAGSYPDEYYLWMKPVTSATPDNVVILTADTILTLVGAPSGYWTNNPYTNISGDSNGWMFLPAIMSNMVWSYRSGSDYAETNENLYSLQFSNRIFSAWWGTSDVSEVDAIANATKTDYDVSELKDYLMCYNDVVSPVALHQYSIAYVKQFAERFWSPLYNSENDIPFSGTIYIGVDRGPANTFSKRDDTNINDTETNYITCLSWTNAINGNSPRFMLGNSDTNTFITNNVGGWGTWKWGDAPAFIVHAKYNVPTNGFKYFR